MADEQEGPSEEVMKAHAKEMYDMLASMAAEYKGVDEIDDWVRYLLALTIKFDELKKQMVEESKNENR